MTKFNRFTCLFLFIVHFSPAQNPIVPDIGMSDPHVRIFNDTVYLFCGHDSSANDKTWIMKDWRVFSSTDLVDWKLESTISPSDNYMADDSRDCWAGDASERNGEYYFYFSDRKRGIGVMTSPDPAGPYHDALGKPLVSPMHDPTILIEDDGKQTPYIVYGDKEGGGYHIAQLNDDMISLAETPKPIIIEGEAWEKAPEWMDKNYLFKYQGTYYLSWGRDYATSQNIYGPYTCAGAVGEGHGLSEYAHGSFFWWKGQFYHIWCYYLRPGYKYRESIITYCHFDDKGGIVTDTGFLDAHFSHGVGRYQAAWPKIEAEWYYAVPEGVRKEGNRKGGFAVTNLKGGSWLHFPKVGFDQHYQKFEARVAITGNMVIEIRADGLDGRKLGEIRLEPGETSGSYQTVSGKLKPLKGEHDIFIRFLGKEASKAQLDWFRFGGD